MRTVWKGEGETGELRNIRELEIQDREVPSEISSGPRDSRCRTPIFPSGLCPTYKIGESTRDLCGLLANQRGGTEGTLTQVSKGS